MDYLGIKNMQIYTRFIFGIFGISYKDVKNSLNRPVNYSIVLSIIGSIYQSVALEILF